MRVFVTGATGFVGQAVAAAFARRGHRVLGLTRSADRAARLARDEVEPVIGSLQEPAAWRERAAGCQVLVHCAIDHAAKAFELDRATVRTLSEIGGRRGTGKMLIYTSGVWVYGDTGDRRVDESSPTNPPKVVAARVENEHFVLSCARPELATLVIRPGCVYGGSGSLTAKWFESAATRGSASFVGDGAQRWAMVHREDLAELYVRAGESGLACEVLNATDRSRSTVRECAEAASRAAGAHGSVEPIPLAEAQQLLGLLAEPLGFSQHVDSGKAVRLLGWQPRHAGFVDEAETSFLAWRAQRA
jgi:nucleoside-diphosphate-sugar epimerase